MREYTENENQFMALAMLRSELGAMKKHQPINPASLTGSLDEVKKVVNLLHYSDKNSAAQHLCASVLESLDTALLLVAKGYTTSTLNSARIVISYILLKKNVFD